MKLAVFSVLLLLGLVSTAPTSKEDEQITIREDFFDDAFKIYEGKHDIVKIYVPLNNINFDDNESSESGDTFNAIFFVEADNKDGETIDQGLYVLKGEKSKKLLDNGRDIAAPPDESKTVFFAAKDGLYTYNVIENKAEKYGAIDDDLIGIVCGNSSDSLFVLTANKEVYKVTDDGNKKVKIDDIKDATQIVLDYGNNLFYVDTDKKVYVVNNDGVKEITATPSNASKVKLIRPPFLLDDGGVPAVFDKNTYIIYPNGTVEKQDFVLEAAPTASSMEVSLIQLYAYDKKIYLYNILTILLTEVVEGLRGYLEPQRNEIETLATNRRTKFSSRAK